MTMRAACLYLLCLGLLGSAACNPKRSEAKKDEAKTDEKAEDTKGDQSKPKDEFAAPPDVKAPPADAEKTPTGVASKVLKAGTGDKKPREFDKVKVHYTGWTTDGKMFDSSRKRGTPMTFGVNQVIPGWTEGLQLMVVGEQRRLWIPERMAYKGQTGRPQGMLVFDVELIDIIEGKPPIPPPPDVAGPPADAKTTGSGLAYKILEKGEGKDKPNSWDRVEVNYTGWTTDGKMFDSSTKRGRPLKINADKVIPGWTEGLQLMSVGDKARLWIPEELAYKGRPGPPKGMLVFDVELLGIERLPQPPQPPKDVAAPPKNAKKTKSGLAYRVLKRGKGKVKPTVDSRVKVHYTGWTTDGKMFDSSIVRGQPTTFPLKGVIAGWTEGLQLMVEGEKTLFWIPEELAYKGSPGKPAGMLVFEIELLEIMQ